MKGATSTKRIFKLPEYFHHISIWVALVTLIVGWTSVSLGKEESYEFPMKEHALKGDSNKQKSIFVFLDGTENNPDSETNVWRLYELLLQNEDPQMTAIYIEGVGSAEDAPIIEAALGHGMEQRVLMGYKFVSINYRPGDDIYLFGFSRGAHQARALAGLISYAGVPDKSGNNSDQLMEVGNQIIELVKKKSDDDYRDKWISWRPDQPPLLAMEIKDRLNLEMESANVAFLGVWDTVPGSSLKDYGACKEEKGFVKKYFWWLVPGIDKGERYKTASYPPIRRIAHAVSLDEKRSKFAPLLLCKELSSKHTQISEVWFPGAHADVGGGYEDSEHTQISEVWFPGAHADVDGGYEDSTGLPSISLEWMIGLLSDTYKIKDVPYPKGNPQGLAHWSIGDRPANIGSKCIDRNPLPGARIHPSVEERKKESPVPIRWEGTPKLMNYPISCPKP